MKTFEQIRNQVFTTYWGRKITMAKVEELAAKEYAKQWIDEAVEISENGILGMQTANIKALKNKIDSHG